MHKAWLRRFADGDLFHGAWSLVTLAKPGFAV
jgi:hypothetical protein